MDHLHFILNKISFSKTDLPSRSKLNCIFVNLQKFFHFFKVKRIPFSPFSRETGEAYIDGAHEVPKDPPALDHTDDS